MTPLPCACVLLCCCVAVLVAFRVVVFTNNTVGVCRAATTALPGARGVDQEDALHALVRPARRHPVMCVAVAGGAVGCAPTLRS